MHCTGSQQSWALTGDSRSAGQARRLLRGVLADPLYEHWLDDAQLAVTELITNVVLHAHTDLVLTIQVEHSRLAVQVRDENPLLPVERHYPGDATTGRGLALVRQISSGYGAQPLAGGAKVVWFVLGTPQITGSPWPLVPDQGVTAPGSPPVPLPHTVQVVLTGAPLSLWDTALRACDAILRELVLYQAAYPQGDIHPTALVQADSARALILAAMEQALAHDSAQAAAQPTLRLWVDADKAEAFVALQSLLARADQLAGANQLLREPSSVRAVALRDWACTQVRSQLDGAPAEPWEHQPSFTEGDSLFPGARPGWDHAAVTDSAAYLVAGDATNRIVAISHPLADLLGWRAADLVGRRLQAMIPARFHHAHDVGFTDHLRTGESAVLGRPRPLPVSRADGTELDCTLTITQVSAQVGRPIFVAAITVCGEVPPTTAALSHSRRTPGADLTQFRLGDMARMASVVRGLGDGQPSLQGYAEQVCRYLYDHLIDATGNRQLMMARFYTTATMAQLPEPDQQLATRNATGPVGPDTTCLTVLASAGDRPGWNDRTTSRIGRTAAITSASQVLDWPILAAVTQQIGIDVAALLGEGQQPHTADHQLYGVFHLDARTLTGSRPETPFYRSNKVASQIGFAGSLPDGALFGVSLFSRVPVGESSVQMFQTLALSTSLGAFSRSGLPLFHGGARRDRYAPTHSPCHNLAAQNQLWTTLVRSHERIAATVSDAADQELEGTQFELQRHAALARALQDDLLPAALPHVPGLQTGTVFRSAGDGTEVGGDFYDLFPTSGDRFALLLGDVSGKGAGAAAWTARARHTARGAAFFAPHSAAVLARLDAELRAPQDEGRYLTALFAFLTVRAGQIELDLALGGHPRPLVLRADGAVEPVGVEGGALGLFPNPSLTASPVLLRSGDTLVAFSDGLTEARRGDTQFGEPRLTALLTGWAGRSADQIADGLQQALRAFQPGAAQDDTAVVVLRCP